MQLLRRIGLLSFIVLFAALVTNAQIKKPGITLGVSLLGAQPKGDFNNAYNIGGGAEVFGGVGIGNTFIIATAGYSAFKADSKASSGLLTYIPTKIGIKQYFLRKHLFVNGDIGRATVKNKTFNESRLTRGFGAGAKLLGLEVGLYYDGFKNRGGGFSNFLDYKIGYSITL